MRSNLWCENHFCHQILPLLKQYRSLSGRVVSGLYSTLLFIDLDTLYWDRNYYLSWVAWNWVINLGFVHPKKAGEHNFFHPVSRNPWQVIILGPVRLTQNVLWVPDNVTQFIRAYFNSSQLKGRLQVVWLLQANPALFRYVLRGRGCLKSDQGK